MLHWIVTGCEMRDLEYLSAHAQMACNQRFLKWEISFHTDFAQRLNTSCCWVAIEITRRDHSTAIRVRCPYILCRDPYLSFVVPGIACDGTCTITMLRPSASWCYCCNLSGGVALIVWFTTNGMCAQNKICVCGANKQYWSDLVGWSTDLVGWSLLLLAATVRSFAHMLLGFPIATKWCCDQDVEVVRSSAFTQRTCDRCGSLQKRRGLLLQPLQWCCVDCVIQHERDMREEQHHTYMWREQAIIELLWHVNSIVACCHGVKLCAHAAQISDRNIFKSINSWNRNQLRIHLQFRYCRHEHTLHILRGSSLNRLGDIHSVKISEILF